MALGGGVCCGFGRERVEGVADWVTGAAAASQGHGVLGISGSFDDSSHSDPEACAALGGRNLCSSLRVFRNSLLRMRTFASRKGSH